MAKYPYEVITVGETTIDAFMTIDDPAGYRMDSEHHDFCIRPGQKINVDQYDFFMGGNATNVAVGLSRMGYKVGLCSEIGDDELSIKIRNSLVKENLERLLVKQTPGASSFSVIINIGGDRTVFVQDVQREHDFHLDDVVTPFVFLTSLGNQWKEPYQKVLRFVEDNNAVLAFNPGGHQLREGKEVIRGVLERTNMLFVNKEEAEMLLLDKQTEQNDKEYIEGLLKQLQALGPKTVVITDGKNGSYGINEQGEMHWLAIDGGKVIERTGAGDAYTSAFIAATIAGLSFEKAMEWGAHNSTSVVAKIGAQAGLLTREEIEHFSLEQSGGEADEPEAASAESSGEPKEVAKPVETSQAEESPAHFMPAPLD
jgi:sugar/nucleoside kinase (ribokinase family)